MLWPGAAQQVSTGCYTQAEQRGHFFRNEWARSARVAPHNMHGPVGGPCANYPQQFSQSHAPGICVGYGNDPVPTSAPMPVYTPHLATDLEQMQDEQTSSQGQSCSDHSDAAHICGDSFHTAQASDDHSEALADTGSVAEGDNRSEALVNCGSVAEGDDRSEALVNCGSVAEGDDHCEALVNSGSVAEGDDRSEALVNCGSVAEGDDRSEALVNSGSVAEGGDHSEALVNSGHVAENEPRLEKEFSFGHGLPEPVAELGPAFLSKLQNKGHEGIPPCTGRGVAAVHGDLGPSSSLINPPVQASRSSKAGGGNTAQVVQAATDVSVAGEVSEVAPPPPARRAVYFTPLHPAHLATMPANEQQTNSRHNPPTSAAPSFMAGVYVTLLPPQARTHSNERQTAGTCEVKDGSSSSSVPSAKVEESDMGEVKEQRPNRKVGPRGSGRAHATKQNSDDAAAGQQTICLSQSRQQGQTDASSQGSESVEVTAFQLVSKSARRRASKNKRKKAQQSTVGSAT